MLIRAELIAIGTELLRFGRRDTNGDWLTERLQRLGVEVRARCQIGDEREAIVGAIRTALDRAELVLVSGGLGPTEDDLTRPALAEALGVELERDADYVDRLRQWFLSRGRPFKEVQARQADRPAGAEWIANTLGTAPGIAARHDGRQLFAMPGVPAELKAMFEASVRPLIKAGQAGALARRTLKVGGRTESSVDGQLADLYETPGVGVTVLTGREGIELHLWSHANTRAAASARLMELEQAFAERLGDDLYGRDDETLPQIVGGLLRERGRTVAVAESCTAGMLGAALTEVPGSSAWFRGGVVAYSDDLKQSLVGVDEETLRRHGAVSPEVATQLAEGVRDRLGADYGLGITGIAGPGGGSAEKPVGLIYLGLADWKASRCHELRTVGDRELIRRRTVTASLDRLRRHLQANP